MTDFTGTPDPRPESAMGGTSDSGAHGRHPASSPGRGSLPDEPIGDEIVERRRHSSAEYRGPERRMAGR
jgi:hypothetical protein